jgi:chromosome segregation ATPase
MMPQDGSLDFKLVQRICLLQQALDQALDTLDELKLRVEDHQLLESQLAQTEEYSNAQQKIITNLKAQLDEKSEWQNHILQKLLLGVQHMINQQQLELERLRVRIQQSQTEVQDYLVRIKNYYQSAPSDRLFEQDLELTSEVMVVRALTVSLSSQLQAAQQHIRELDTSLTRHQVNFARLLAYQESIVRQLADPDSLTQVETEAWEEDPIALMQIIRAQQQKLEELNHELSEQFRQQNRLKYRCQELAAERDHYKRQLLVLQQENADLREQVLSQASQASEYEAAIHYWRQHSAAESALIPIDPELS